MIRTSHYFIITILFLFFAFSCGEESNEGDVVVHPVEEKIPHSEVSAQMLEVLSASDYIEELPESVQSLYRVLNDSTAEQNSKKLDIITTNRLDISAINDSTLLILEKDKDRMLRYNLSTDTSEVVAAKGRGPGDLIFSKELTVHGGKAYIGMQGYQISVFDCRSGKCEHEKVIKTEYNNYSLAPTGDHIYFLGIAPFGREQNPDPENTDQFAIHRADLNGNVEQSFLPVYYDEIPEVRDRMMKSGEIRTFPQFGKTLVTLARLPFLYTYDSFGELISKNEFPFYIESYGYSSIKEQGGGWTTNVSYDGDYTRIFYSSKLNERWVLLKVTEYRDVKLIFAENRAEGSQWVSYYALDVRDDQLYKIGDDRSFDYGKSRMLYAVGPGIFSNNEGEIHWIKDSAFSN
jgi:hypothetical protein